MTFVKLSRPMILLLLGYYPMLYNYVDERNADSIKWLRWCGARMQTPAPYGVAGMPFRKFVFQRSDYV